MGASISKAEKVDVMFQANATLAEGPIWDDRRGCLYWLDIRRRRVSCLDPESGRQTGVWIMPKRPGCIALTSDPDKLLIAIGADIILLNLQTGAMSKIALLPIDALNFRANDGRVDAHGRLWVGAMIDDVHEPERFTGGRVFGVDPDGGVTELGYDFELPNGIGWSPDGALIYINDTTARVTYCFDFDAELGALSNQRVFFDHSEGEGFPDGLSVDECGCVWSSQWDGWNIRKISPDGVLLEEIPMPVRRPSSVTFFGPDMNRIAITSATVDFTTSDFLSSPDAGSILSMLTDSVGRFENRFLLTATGKGG